MKKIILKKFTNFSEFSKTVAFESEQFNKNNSLLLLERDVEGIEVNILVNKNCFK